MPNRSDSSVLRTTDSDAWNRTLAELPIALQDLYFSADYHRMYELNGDGEARLFIFREGRRLFVHPFLQRSIATNSGIKPCSDISSAYGYSGPLSSTMDAGFLRTADAAFVEYCRKESVVTEFIRFHPLLQNQRYAAASVGMELVHLRDYVAVNIAETEEEQQRNYSPQNRNMIRKSISAGVKVIPDLHADRFNEFVSIYLDKMRQLGAAPLYYFSDAFFTALRDLVRSSGFLLIAEQERECLGAAVFLHNGNYAHYFLAANTTSGRKTAAGNLLLHEAVNLFRNKGCRLLHLGGGVTASEHDPLLFFKKGFSRTTVPYHIGKRIHDGESYRQLIEAWELQYPELIDKYGSLVQRYRMTPDTH